MARALKSKTSAAGAAGSGAGRGKTAGSGAGRGKAKNGNSAGPTRKRARIEQQRGRADGNEQDDDDDEGGSVNGAQAKADSEDDSDADDALAFYGEEPGSDEDLPAIIDSDDDEDDDDLSDSDDDQDELSDEDDDEMDQDSDEEDNEDDDAREDRYAARVSRSSKRTEIQKTEEDDRLSRKRLPVRGLAGDWNEENDNGEPSEAENEDDDDDDEEDEEGKALAAAYDEAAATVIPSTSASSAAKNRAIHDDRVLDKLRSEQAKLAAEAAAEEANDHRTLSAKARKMESQAAAVASNSLLHGNRFGLLAPYAVMTLPKRSLRIHHAREQIAHLSQNIVNDPEVGLAHLRRLLVFAGRDVLAPLRTPTGQIGDGEEGGEGAFQDEDGAPTLSNKKRKRELWKRRQQNKKKANGDDDDGDGENSDDDDDMEDALPSRPRAEIDPPIRQLALLSLMAVFSDIIPGYRIRALTDEEKAQKTTQDVARRREWEEGLLKSYRDFLELCEEAIKARDELSSSALHALCHILTRATHFNYRQNLLRLIIARLSRSRARNAASASLAADAASSNSTDGSTSARPAVTKGSWDADCTQCSSALVEVLQRDHSGEVSLEVVRLLHRMIKEGGYAVDARVLDILLHLRLKEELGDVRASMTASVGGRFSKRKHSGEGLGREDPRHRMGKGKVKPKDVRKGKGEHLSKKAVKKMREVREIEKEMKEADAEVDKEEREKHHTETLKLLFVLYFSILKSPSAPSALLCSALDGLCKYGHRINVEFFRDLIRVLRDLVVEARRQSEGGGIGSVYVEQGPLMLNGVKVPNGPTMASTNKSNGVPGYPNGSVYGIGGQSQAKRSHRDTLCLLLTAFDLLFSQGQSLSLDLSDFVAHLYSVMLSLALEPAVEDAPVVLLTEGDRSNAKDAVRAQRRDARAAKGFAASSLADLLFRTLELALLKPRTSTLPPERLGSFVKRLLSCALHWPAGTAVRALGIVRTIVARDARLEALFETEDRAVARKSNVPTTSAAAATASHNHQQKHGGRGNLAAATLANLSDEVLDRVAGSAGPDEKGPLGAGEVAWEVVLLAQHVNEDVRDAAVKVLGSVGTAPKNPGATRRR